MVPCATSRMGWEDLHGGRCLVQGLEEDAQGQLSEHTLVLETFSWGTCRKQPPSFSSARL